MTTSHQQVHVGPRDGSRYQPVIALINTASTYAVMPSPMLGIDPYWPGVVELASGDSEERSFAEIRVIALINTASTYAVMPSPMLSLLGIDPYWTGVAELASGDS